MQYSVHRVVVDDFATTAFMTFCPGQALLRFDEDPHVSLTVGAGTMACCGGSTGGGVGRDMGRWSGGMGRGGATGVMGARTGAARGTLRRTGGRTGAGCTRGTDGAEFQAATLAARSRIKRALFSVGVPMGRPLKK
jgi:hypothetical protein